MNVLPPRSWGLIRFLDWGAAQETRHEFDGVSPVAVTGGTAGHEMIGATLRAMPEIGIDLPPAACYAELNLHAG